MDELPLPDGLRLERLPAAAFAGGILRGRESGDPEVMARREAMILDFARQWRPTGILVDHLALGLAGEMTSTLLAAADESWPTRVYWGVRDGTADPGQGEGPPVPRNPRLRRALEVFSGVLVYFQPGLAGRPGLFRGISPAAGGGAGGGDRRRHPIPRSGRGRLGGRPGRGRQRGGPAWWIWCAGRWAKAAGRTMRGCAW